MNALDSRSLVKELQDQKQALDQAAIVAATDREGRICYVNDLFCQISEYSRDELLGRDHRLINSGYHPPEFFSSMWKTISSGQVWRAAVCNRAKSGRLYWVNTTIVPFLDQSGRPYQYLSIRQDITELRNAEQVIRDQQAKLVAASKLSALGELAAALTHEINNPLAVILGRTEMLSELLRAPTVDLEQIAQMVESVSTTAQRIEKIMKTVRSLAHGGEAEPLQRVSLASVVESALDIIGARLRHHGIRMICGQMPEDLQLECRPTEIFQIIVNLLSNSHDAILGTSEPWVQIQARELEGGFQIEITDSGAGVPKGIAERLFQPFFTTKQVGVGTGLGLTISTSLAARNGARLFYDSSCANTRFCLWLPRNGPSKPLRA